MLSTIIGDIAVRRQLSDFLNFRRSVFPILTSANQDMAKDHSFVLFCIFGTISSIYSCSWVCNQPISMIVFIDHIIHFLGFSDGLVFVQAPGSTTVIKKDSYIPQPLFRK